MLSKININLLPICFEQVERFIMSKFNIDFLCISALSAGVISVSR